MKTKTNKQETKSKIIIAECNSNSSPALRKEFNLSEKRYYSDEGVDRDGVPRSLTWHYTEEDVKEFIKILKRKLMKIKAVHYDWNVEGTINSLAGEKLI